MSVLTGCHTSKNSQQIQAVEGAKIGPIALASIAAKYPNLDTSQLVLESMSRETPPVGKKFISVLYNLPSPGQTNFYDTPEGKRVKITTKGFGVVMSPSREVLNVSECPIENIFKVDQ